MEITLSQQAGTQILVTCDGQPSHSFDLHTLAPGEKAGPPQPLKDPETFGKAVYQALFPAGSAARTALDKAPERILLVPIYTLLDSVPWEYAYGRYGAGDTDNFLVLECQFARGLPSEQRITSPTLANGLHIVAIPSNPLDADLPALNIDGEWVRLKEIIQQVPFAITLERARPSTMEQVRSLVANQRQRVLHFMGHGGQQETGAVLCFEQENGSLDRVAAREFLQRVRGTVFLVTLNACVSATPGETYFGNLAAALVRQKTPYALGMRFNIMDEYARPFSRSFYSELARGSSVEEALFQARLTLAKSSHTGAIGVPVLYTALAEPSAGFQRSTGTPTVMEHQPPVEATIIPRADGVFQGRIDELRQLGMYLTGDNRPRIVTIHGGGGQGKTALARETVERFAYAWPGGVWATTLETLPGKEILVGGLAHFLGIDTQNIADPDKLERLVLQRLNQQRTLIVLDNAETLVQAVGANDEAAISLAQFIRERLLSPMVSLLVTSREYLNWDGEVGLKSGDLQGLTHEEGASLFRQSAPQRLAEAPFKLAAQLSSKVNGHPLSLRLLGSAFNLSTLSLPAFIQDCETYLLAAENKYVGVDNRHRSLYACIETSVRYLDEAHRQLFSRLWLFHAPFFPEIAAAIFDDENRDGKDDQSPVYEQLDALWRHGLVGRDIATIGENRIGFYRLLPGMRQYIEQYLAQADERQKLLTLFGAAYAHLVRMLFDELDRRGAAAFLALQFREDIERGASYVTGAEQGYYLLRWGWILKRLGDIRHGLQLTEQVLEIGQSLDRRMELQALNNIAMVHEATGQRQRALEAFHQALSLSRAMGNRADEATVLSNLATIYENAGQPQRALELHEQALPVLREVGNRGGEAGTLINIGTAYRKTGQLQRALEVFEQALSIMREMGNRADEATALNNIAYINQALGQPQRAKELYEQSLSLSREVSDRDGEATTLDNIAQVYSDLKQPQRALELFMQVLSLKHELGDRVGEGRTLNSIAKIYRASGQLQPALELFEQTLLLRRAAGDRAGEVATLNNIGVTTYELGQPQRSLELLEQALALSQEAGDLASQANTLTNSALVLYKYLNRPQEALARMERAIAIMEETGLSQDEAGRTLEELQRFLNNIRQGIPYDGDATISAAQIQLIISTTISMMTTAQDHRDEWRVSMVKALEFVQQQGSGWHNAVEFITAVIAILDGKPPTLTNGNPYSQVITTIQDGIARGGMPTNGASMINYDEMIQALNAFVNAADLKTMRHILETRQAVLFRPEVEVGLEQNAAQARGSGNQSSADILEASLAILRACKTQGIDEAFKRFEAAQENELPFDAELIPRSVWALLGGPKEKMELMEYLNTLAAQTQDEELKALIHAILMTLFGDRSLSGQQLNGAYRQAWEAIVSGVEQGGKVS